VKTRFEQRRHPSPPETRNINTSVMRRRGGFHHVQVYSTGTPLRVLLASEDIFLPRRGSTKHEEWFGSPLRADQWFGSF
jgi:hypothetical protein